MCIDHELLINHGWEPAPNVISGVLRGVFHVILVTPLELSGHRRDIYTMGRVAQLGLRPTATETLCESAGVRGDGVSLLIGLSILGGLQHLAGTNKFHYFLSCG